MGNPLDPATIAALLEADKKQAATKGTRAKKDPTEPRVYSTWWRLHQTHGSCDNPDCIDPREGGGFGGKAMVAVVQEKNTCRHCFLGGWLSGTTS